MFNFFSWLRAKSRDAVLGGIGDALDELDQDDAPADLDTIRKRLAAPPKAIAAKVDDDAKGKRAK